MTSIACINNANITARNDGIRKENLFRFTMTGSFNARHDNGSFDKGSDVLDYSVKASAFTLMSGSTCIAQDFDGIVSEFFSRTASTLFAYVSNDLVAYIMNPAEFKEFIYNFCRLEKESSKNGGRMKVRMKKESRFTIEWLEAHLASN